MSAKKRKAPASSPPRDAEHHTPDPSNTSRNVEDGFARRSKRNTTHVSYEEDMTDGQSASDASDYENNGRKKKTPKTSYYENNRRKKKNKMMNKRKNKRDPKKTNTREQKLASIARDTPSDTSPESPIPTPTPYTPIENHHGTDPRRGGWVVGTSTSDIEALDAELEARFETSAEEMGHVSNLPGKTNEKKGEELVLRKEYHVHYAGQADIPDSIKQDPEYEDSPEEDSEDDWRPRNPRPRNPHPRNNPQPHLAPGNRSRRQPYPAPGAGDQVPEANLDADHAEADAQEDPIENLHPNNNPQPPPGHGAQAPEARQANSEVDLTKKAGVESLSHCGMVAIVVLTYMCWNWMM
ncbi:hypothetical protein P171DRAFT_488298 [Karstenula rhodostoma CBS 690.94]|uniref:Uncharacterized protein n=1 Tax=Karstenula rhodostoma CBS 690.94 TaxID=1392251 RepID=A0A9P4PBB2_9PLEO|nr:hypothetical protein P171DRAFT_488298 [Karstenula rhodostoma CBS 690.94]